LAGRKKVRLSDCVDYNFVFPDGSLTSRRLLLNALKRANVHPLGIVTTNSIEVMKMLVREHHQIAVLGLPDVTLDLIDGDLVHIPFADGQLAGTNLSLIARKHVRLSPAVAMLAERLKEELTRLSGT
jgi:DNA-binding transcriptional LysR family regulator